MLLPAISLPTLPLRLQCRSDSCATCSDIFQLKEEPKILPLPNGPYYLINHLEPKIVEYLRNSEGKPLSTIRGVALCRCGVSKNKPFCDGTHGIIRFSSENKAAADNGKNMIRDKKKSYVGNQIAINDNRKICSHAAECVNNLPSVFKLNARLWIDPNGATVEDNLNGFR